MHDEQTWADSHPATEIDRGAQPQPSQNIPRMMEIAKKFGLEFLPPPSA